ncbi:MAG: methionyl-tRNA formyltransferase, partial [Eubacterium sp.]|nr:methionyl-tRNA formyltransferase [Eubacterium sp.]
MKIVFMGTPDFAVPCLEKLNKSNNEVVGVFSQPDKPVGRKQILTPPPVKAYAIENGIPVFQPEKLKDGKALEIIRKLSPDIIVVVAYGRILPKEILTAAKYGCINVHASLLPKYRGAAPIQWAVINGEEKTGVCVMQMDEGLDTGDILLVRECSIGENETSAELFDKLSLIGADALLETLSLIESGNIKPIKQPEGDFGYAKMITKELCPIDWNKSAREVHNLIRGLQTWPVATTVINSKTVKIHKSILSDVKGNNAG